MDYEKLYNAALERAKKNYITAQDLCEGAQIGVECFKNTLESIFPELKDEDERIRKEIIYFLSRNTFQFGEDIDKYKSWVAWLEKQGKKEQDARYKYLEELLEADTIYQMAMNDAMVADAKNKAINALQELSVSKILGLKKLEEQGEQKAQAKSAIEAWKDMRLEVYQQASGNRHEVNYSDDTTKMFSLNDIDEIIEKISEQKLADKTEPKFHEGDWITDDYNIFYVDKIKDDKYFGTYLTDEFDETIDGKIAFKSEKYYHHLTIKDLIKRYGRKL